MARLCGHRRTHRHHPQREHHGAKCHEYRQYGSVRVNLLHEKRRLRRLKSRAPAARRPYQLTREVLPHHGAKRSLFPKGRDGAPPPSDSPAAACQDGVAKRIGWSRPHPQTAFKKLSKKTG